MTTEQFEIKFTCNILHYIF